jgi:outer membrane protein assembly factor BamD
MLKKIKFILLILPLFSILSCSNYNKLLKSSDYELKYEMAIKYYEDENYYKASPLLEELTSLYKGTARAEKIYFYYAYCNYHMGDYELAGFHFKNFVKTYPGSQYSEEAYFMNAYTHFVDSNEPSLDQTQTYRAITELQMFINKFPKSEKAKEATELIDKLRFKLETKTYNICKQYFRTQNYKAAVVSINNAQKDFPASKYNEELLFLAIKSNYLYALNSIEGKKAERYKNTVEAFELFKEKFPNSPYLKEAANINESVIKAINKQSNI